MSVMHRLVSPTVLEVYQFARDAAVAEAWLAAHEPYLQNHEYGVSTGLVQQCILLEISRQQQMVQK